MESVSSSVEAVSDCMSTVLQSYPKVCAKCGAKKDTWKLLAKHHVLYRPDWTIKLCKSCHARITFLNHHYALKLHRQLTAKERLIIWGKFTKEVTDETTKYACVKWFNAKFKKV